MVENERLLWISMVNQIGTMRVNVVGVVNHTLNRTRAYLKDTIQILMKIV